MTPELIRWSGLCNTFERELKLGTPTSAPTSVFTTSSEFGEKRWTDLKKRVVEHVSSINFVCYLKRIDYNSFKNWKILKFLINI